MQAHAIFMKKSENTSLNKLSWFKSSLLLRTYHLINYDEFIKNRIHLYCLKTIILLIVLAIGP